MKTLVELGLLWNELGDIPVDETGEYLEEDFQHFKAGVHREEVWHWFEEQNPKFLVKDQL